MIDERIDEREIKKQDENKQRNSGKTQKQENDVSTRKKRSAFLDLLLEAYDKEEISRAGVREEVDTFMFEVRTLIFYLKYQWLSFPTPEDNKLLQPSTFSNIQIISVMNKLNAQRKNIKLFSYALRLCLQIFQTVC